MTGRLSNRGLGQRITRLPPGRAGNPGQVGDQIRAARVSTIVDGAVAGQVLIEETWTDELALSTRINRQVAHYTNQEEIADAIHDGLEARKNGDPDTAVLNLGRAVKLAHGLGQPKDGRAALPRGGHRRRRHRPGAAEEAGAGRG